jgi:competence protein ComEA
MTHLNSTKSTKPIEAPRADRERRDPIGSHSLRPWKGLFLLAIAWLACREASDIRARLFHEPNRPPAHARVCAYMLMQNGEVLGTVTRPGVSPLREVAAQTGVTLPWTFPGPDELVPCDRIVELDRPPEQRALQPISGRALIALGVPLDVNTARAEDLEALRGIGPKLAGRIVEHREKHGPYRSMEELAAIVGVGPKKLEAMSGLLAVKSELRP